jgi:Flp pilus assembly protein CpaB
VRRLIDQAALANGGPFVFEGCNMKQKNIIMMAVAVGFGLVAALLTSQMSAKSTVETVDVMVAAKDLPVGTLLTKEDVANDKVIKWKKIPKDAIPPGIVESTDELVDKRLSRAIRAEETINRADVTKGGVVTIPAGMKMSTVQLAAHQAVAGFVGPGSRVDVLGTVRLGEKVIALPILVDMLVLAVNTETTYSKDGVFPAVNTVSFAVTQKQALLIKLAQARGSDMSLLLRNPEDPDTKLDTTYDIDAVINLLRNERNPADVIVTEAGTIESVKKPDPEVKVETPKLELLKVPYALVVIAPGTELTKDLVNDPKVFGVREMPAQFAQDAVLDLNDHLTKVLKNGLGKGQWVTKSLVGDASLKAGPQDAFNPPKGGPGSPANPASLAKKKTHDLQIHTASGTRTFRYVEVEPGEWKLWGEVKGAQERPALEEPTPAKKPEPQAD